MSLKDPKFVLDEPIDFEVLSDAYAAVRWRWSKCGIPNAKEIESTVKELEETAKRGTHYCSSGGLTVRIIDRKTWVAIDRKLHDRLPVDTRGSFDGKF